MQSTWRQRRSFTLIELLVTMGVIAVLGGLLVGALGGVGKKVEIGATKSQIENFKTALATYNTDHRRYPRLTPPGSPPEQLLRDDAPALYAALMNDPTPQLGGGRNGPYLKRSAELRIGIMTDLTRLEADTMGKDGVGGAKALSARELDKIYLASFQTAHGPRSGSPLVFLDTWGNPYHYREWDSVGPSKKALMQTPIPRTGFSSPMGEQPVAGPVPDLPHDPYGYEIWSSGPNGVNEYGDPASDDVCSWR